MINTLMRTVVVLWAALFGAIGVQGLFASAPYLDLLGPLSSATGVNTARADLSAFFLVSAAFALIGVVRQGAARLCVVPAALFGTALAGRALGVVLGDEPTPQVIQAMIVEAISLTLMLIAMRRLAKSTPIP